MTTDLATPSASSGTGAAAAGARLSYSINEAAALLGVSRQSIWRWVRAGRLPVARLGHRTVRIAREDLEGLLTQIGPDGARSWIARGHGAGGEDDTIPSRLDGDGPRAAAHVVQFYDADAYLLDRVAEFIGAALGAGDAGIVVATAAHRAGIDARLCGSGLDVAAARTGGRYRSLDAAELLSCFMVGGVPDAARFAEVVGGIVAQAAAGDRPVRIFGEMVALLVAEGDPAGAVRLEQLWNDLQRTHAFTLLCAYPIDRLGGEHLADLLDEVCAEHADVIPAESYLSLATPRERRHAVASLQQKERWLEAEIRERRLAVEAQAWLAAIVEGSDDAIIGKTLDGIITSWNGGAERLYGYTAAEVIGRPIALLIPPDRPDELPAIMARLTRGERIEHYETVRRRKDGTLLDVALTISPVRGAEGDIIGASAIARDITERRRVEAALRRSEQALREAVAARDLALAEARAALRVREEFIGSVSHDLRTPLSIIKGLTQLLLRQAGRGAALAGDQLERPLTEIERATTKMNGMIDELLDLSRLDTGRPLDLQRQPTDLVALARQLAADHQRTTSRHRIVVESAAPTLVGSWDAGRLERVLSNLLSNAVKYSPDGGEVRVRVATAEAGDGSSDDDWVDLTVQDSGMGIPAADLPHIFDRFHRATNVGGIRGAGVGLAGVKQIVEQHGGTLAVTSAEGAGSVFTLRLPRQPLDEAPTEPHA